MIALRTLVATVVLLEAAAIGRAESVTANFLGEQYGSNISATLTPNPFGGSSYTVSGGVGGYQWHQFGTPDPSFSTNFTTYCIELTQFISSANNPFTYQVVDLTLAPDPGLGIGHLSAANAEMLRQLWGQDVAAVHDADTASAFQFAVWRVVYGTELSSDSKNSHGQYYLDHGVTPGTADDLLRGLNATGARANLFALSSPNYQDQVACVPVPLPGAVCGGLALLCTLGLWKFFRRRFTVSWVV